jgi:hypothetical protein
MGPGFLAVSTEIIEEIFLFHGLNYNQSDCRRGPIHFFRCSLPVVPFIEIEIEIEVVFGQLRAKLSRSIPGS